MRIKYESRVAGGVFYNPLIVVSIFRGKLWLDGIIIELVKLNPFIDIINAIKSSKFFDEINFIFFGDGLCEYVDLEYAYKFLGKPVVLMDRGKTSFYGINSDDFKCLMKVACVRGEVEALRISRIIALKILGSILNL
ncbi:MAG: hypothetical protein N3E39_04295 [Candidatus Methanomethylicia archaeon]|nr:hypothetical protein [Candidatus Methanomethylicia archaeon]